MNERLRAPGQLLLVEDDESLRRVLATELRRMGHQVEALPDGNGVVAALQRAAIEVVLLDLNLPGRSGMELLPVLAQQAPEVPVVVCTAHGSVAVAVQAMQHGAFDFLTKPVGLDVLEQTVRRALTHGRLLRDKERLQRAAAHTAAGALEVAPASAAARHLEQQLQRVARADQPVLVRGESGTGKELVARRLHALSARREQPFVVVHCGAIPRHLVESELFGHTKGAFTGAEQRRLGLFEAASGGTLFLDEVGELPLDVQPALLRAAQFGEIRPVGADQVRHVDVRLCAATHRDLRQKVQDGTFREDLYYRLAVLELHVPPLRDRREDIPGLAAAMLAREARRAGRALQLDAEAIERLVRHDWPGNVRELENAIVRLAVLADGPVVTARDIAAHVSGPGPTPRAPGALPTLELHALEAMAIEQALQQCDGNKTKAAQLLGIALRTLHNKLHAADAGRSRPPDAE